jgi:6,7-dimethyl-8-ribityllumazine synthase
MASALPTRPRFASSRRSIAVVASQYNGEHVQALVDNFKAEMEAIASGSAVSIFDAPGAFEIPLIVQEVAESGSFDAVVAFGVVIEGATRHAEFIGRTVTEALMQISLRQRRPVIHEVLVLKDENQARERCIEQKLNRGVEAARTVTMALQALTQARGR